MGKQCIPQLGRYGYTETSEADESDGGSTHSARVRSISSPVDMGRKLSAMATAWE
jgi:hypothetical protein